MKEEVEEEEHTQTNSTVVLTKDVHFDLADLDTANKPLSS